MSDIVERLRSKTTSLTMLNKQESLELADEIERLQQEKDQAVRAMAEMRKKMHDQEDRIEELEAGHIPLDARLSVSCVLEMGQLPHDLLLAVNGEPTDQAIDCRALLGPYERRIEELEIEAGGAAWCLEWLVADKYRKPDAPAIVKAAQKHYRATLKRIEELEYAFGRAGRLTITHKQIDAAWEEANKTTGTQYENVTLLRFLKKHFGIKGCENCDGGGVIEQEVIIGEHFVTHEMAMDAGMPETEGSHYGYEYGSETAPCPDCGGHGWVRPEKP